MKVCSEKSLSLSLSNTCTRIFTSQRFIKCIILHKYDLEQRYRMVHAFEYYYKRDSDKEN